MWRIAKDCQLCWRKWDEEYVVYNSGSGDTHLLDAFGGEILTYLEERPSNLHELAIETAGGIEPDKIQIVRSRIEELLVKFQGLGLVEFI